MKLKRNFLIISMLLVLILAMTACGNPGSDDATASTDDTTPTTENTETSTTTQEEAEPSATENTRQPDSERRLRLIIDDSVTVYATLVDSLAVDLFVEQLPFTIDMDTYIERNKRGPLPFVIDDEDLHNIIYPFETGDIIYYPPGPLLGIFYDHNGAEISAGYELLARLDEEGIAAFAAASAELTVTVELDE